MPGRYLLDTNIAIAFLIGERGIIERVAAADAAYTSVVTLGELYYGAAKSGRVAQNVQRVEQFASQIAVLDCDLDTARQYGLIKERLRSKGSPIPDNDLWIAALALQHKLTLLSRDQHFQRVDSLNWVDI
jgi:tRNA(fMet)-specific endonuclease VapC